MEFTYAIWLQQCGEIGTSRLAEISASNASLALDIFLSDSYIDIPRDLLKAYCTNEQEYIFEISLLLSDILGQVTAKSPEHAIEKFCKDHPDELAREGDYTAVTVEPFNDDTNFLTLENIMSKITFPGSTFNFIGDYHAVIHNDYTGPRESREIIYNHGDLVIQQSILHEKYQQRITFPIREIYPLIHTLLKLYETNREEIYQIIDPDEKDDHPF